MKWQAVYKIVVSRFNRLKEWPRRFTLPVVAAEFLWIV
jgi:hypothetical protein